MKALLMHEDRDLDLAAGFPRHERALAQDLALDTLLRAMARDDGLVLDVSRRALLCGLANDVDTILYRQDVLKDCLGNPETVRALYALAVEAIENRRKHYFGIYSRYPGSILHGAVELLQMFVGMLRRLRTIADAEAGRFGSHGLTRLFCTVQDEFTDEYFARIEAHLRELKFRSGVLLSAELGEGTAGTRHMLRLPLDRRPAWLLRLLGKRKPAYTFHLHERDEAGGRILSELRERGINAAANAVAQSAEHVLGFFHMLRAELAFYVGCLNLHERLAALGTPVCIPQPQALRAGRHRAVGLRDVSLALSMGRSVVGNALEADGKRLVIVTGANQGGKSSFLRSVALAQLMMQAGMFVAAESFSAELCAALFTHYRREEDAAMEKGKLDEELSRMSELVEALAPNALLLFNESFAATNEREGSEIARQIVGALLDSGAHARIFYVTHLYEFARGVFDAGRRDALFLRAERRADGTRTFRVVEAEPLATSFGEDLYRRIFVDAAEGAEA